MNTHIKTLAVASIIGLLSPNLAWAVDRDGDGYDESIDCDDDDPSIYPGAPEIHDGMDNDCDGVIDEGFSGESDCSNGSDDDGDGDIDCDDSDCDSSKWCIDADEDGYALAEDCDDEDSSIYPGADELCDELDNDCDSEIDEDPVYAATWYPDADADGYGESDSTDSTTSCDPLTGYVDNDEDCDDEDEAVHPDADEICDDSVDNDCDGLVDLEDEDCDSVDTGEGDTGGADGGDSSGSSGGEDTAEDEDDEDEAKDDGPRTCLGRGASTAALFPLLLLGGLARRRS